MPGPTAREAWAQLLKADQRLFQARRTASPQRLRRLAGEEKAAWQQFGETLRGVELATQHQR